LTRRSAGITCFRMKEEMIVFLGFPDEPGRNRYYKVLGLDEIKTACDLLEEHFGQTKARQKRIILTEVTDTHRKYLKPGDPPLFKGQIFRNGRALADALGLKSPNRVSQAIGPLKRLYPDDPTRWLFAPIVAGVKGAYVEDYDGQFGAGKADAVSREAVEEQEAV
jgi:hypothetical protein